MARRARVRASMELDLAWRDRNLRRSDAFWELTRYTAWPRRPKNTAMGSHAGPVGSTTTSSTVPSGVPSRACCSIHSGLSAVGTPFLRHTSVPSPVSTTTVWAVAMPRSMPAILRSAMAPPFRGRVIDGPRLTRGGDASSTTVPRWLSPTAAPTHVLQTGPAARGRPTSLNRGIRGRAGGGHQPSEAPHLPVLPSESTSTPPSRTSRAASCNPGTSGRSSTEARYMSHGPVQTVLHGGPRVEGPAGLRHLGVLRAGRRLAHWLLRS